MSKYRPFKIYKTLEMRKLSERNACWKEFGPRDAGEFIIRELRDDQKEFRDTAETFREGFPELYGSLYDFLLYEEKYHDFLGKGTNFLRDEGYMMVAEDKKNKEIASALYLHLFKKNLSVELSAGVVRPRYRRASVFRKILKLADEAVTASGVEYAYGYAATFHPVSQKMLRELGFIDRGIIPGFLLVWMGDDRYYRHPTVFLDKFYNGGEKVTPTELIISPV